MKSYPHVHTHIKVGANTHTMETSPVLQSLNGILVSAMEFEHHCQVLSQERRLCYGFFADAGDRSTYGEILMTVISDM